MTQDVSPRVLQLFKARMENDPEISETTVNILLNNQHQKTFGDDEEILEAIVEAQKIRR